MPRHGGSLALGPIHVHRMVAAFPQQLTTVHFEMLDEVAPLQAAVIFRGSRMTDLLPRVSSARARLASRTSRTASSRLDLASSSVGAWVLAPGSSSTKAM